MDEEPTLEDILALGGTEEDIELFKDKTKTTKDVTSGEISEFMSTIGLTPGMEMDGQDDELEEEPSVIKKNKKEKTSKVISKEIAQSQKEDKIINQQPSGRSQDGEKHNKNKFEEETKKDTVKKKRNAKDEGSTTSKRKRNEDLTSTRKKKKNEKIVASPTSPSPDSPTAFNKTENKLRSIKYSDHSKLLVPLLEEMDGEMTPWFEQSHSSVNERTAYSSGTIEHLCTLAKRVMTNELVLYKSIREKKKKKDLQWLKTVLSSGTLNDKMAALTLIVQESPVHTLSTIDQFISMASKKGKRECILSIDTFKDLVIADLLPEDRKLKSMAQRPLHELLMNDGRFDFHRLLLWYYEDQLKERYKQFINVLVSLLHDPVAQIREKILGVVFDLLYKKPEQEQALLQSVVNKMGDPNRRIASKCILLLLKLLNHHVNMKEVVVKQIESLLYRPNLTEKAQYYAICFLNQIVIAPADQRLALKLSSVYFSFFKVYTSKDQFEAKILSAILTGVNRALPFLKTDMPSFEDHMNSLFKIAHVGPLATGIQSLVLLYQVMESRQAVSARYYRTLYEKLLDPRISLSSTQQAMFLNLLFKSVKNDPELDRVKAFLKRILQTCSYHGPHFIAGCLLLVSEVLKLTPSLWSYVLRSEGEEMEHFEDVIDKDDQDSLEVLDDEVTEVKCDKEQSKEVFPEGFSLSEGYLIDKREPLYCKAEVSCLWELSKLSNHYHPTVQVFAKKLVQGACIVYTGDPLNDFTLLRFLDQFAHKNIKQPKGDKGGSLMQPIPNTRPYTLPMSLNELANMESSKVREDLLFIHEFMKRDKALHKGKYSKKLKKKEQASDSEDSDSEDNAVDDYAGELEKSVNKTKETKKKKIKPSENSSADEDQDSEPSYSDMGDSDFEDELSFGSDSEIDSIDDREGTKKNKKKEKFKKDEMDEAELENLLLDNLTSSEDEENEEFDDDMDSIDVDSKTLLKKKSAAGKKRKNDQERQKPNKKKKDSALVFESVDKFAHLLNDDRGRNSQKQNDWEVKRSFDGRRGDRKSFDRNNQRGRGRSRGDSSSGRRGRGRGPSSGRGGRNFGQQGRGYNGNGRSQRGSKRGGSRGGRGKGFGGRGGVSRGRGQRNRGSRR